MKKKKTKPCPICRKPAPWEDNPWRPFCSERCKIMDLGAWASGRYKIAGEKTSTTEGESPADIDAETKEEKAKR